MLRAVANSCAGDTELSAFWAEAGERFVAAAARQIQRERDAGLALPAPPSTTELAIVLTSMTERVCSAATQRDLAPHEHHSLTDALAAVWHRAIYGVERR